MSAVSFGEMAAGLVGQVGRGERIGSKVHARSYDENSPQADIFRPICGGDREEFEIWRAQVMQTAYDFDNDGKAPGAQSGPLGDNGLRVLRALLYEFLNYQTGACFPALITIAEKIKRSKVTVKDALDRLATHGFVMWVRRTKKTGNKRGEGPQQVQISNAYKLIDPAKMLDAVLKSIRSRIANRKKFLAAKANLKKAVTAKKEIDQQKAVEREEAATAPKRGKRDILPPTPAGWAEAMAALARCQDKAPSNASTASSGPELYPL